MLLIAGAEGLNAQSLKDNYKLMGLKDNAGNVELKQQPSSLNKLSPAPKQKSPSSSLVFRNNSGCRGLR